MRLIHCSCVMVTMVASRFSLRRSKRRDLSAASTYRRCGAARVLVLCQCRGLSLVSEGMGSSTEAPRLRRRYRRNRNFAGVAMYVALGYTEHPVYFLREQFSTLDRRRRVSSYTSYVGCAGCARLRRALDAGKHPTCWKPAPGQFRPGYAVK